MSMRTSTHFDDQLTTLLAADTPVFLPNTELPVTSADEGQFAVAVTGGYRARFAWSGRTESTSPREGLYVAANYNYLRGFRYEDVGLSLRLDTDRNGFATLAAF